jgi:hypothetical protein
MTLSHKLNRFFFTAALSAITFFGCDGADSVATDTTPHPAFSATINGKPWAITATDSLDERIYAIPEMSIGKLVLHARQNPGVTYDDITIRISSPKEGVNFLNPSLDQTEQTARYIPGDPTDSVYYMNLSDSGQVIIDHYDETTTRISGSFWFTASNSQSKQLAVTSGTFKDMLIRR